MTARHAPKEDEVNSRELTVRFSPPVAQALSALAEAARKSEHFDSEMTGILTEWGRGQATTMHDVMTALPLISEQMAAHVGATNDEGVKDAWRDLCVQLPENGFVVSQARRSRQVR